MRFYSGVCVLVAVSVGLVAGACGSSNAGTGSGNDEPKCLAKAADTSCTPLYEPTFDNVFKNTLSTTCAAPGCHSGSQPTGGMALDEIDKAYTNILATSSTLDPRITPGDVTCGKVLVRLESKDKTYSMPPPPAELRNGEVCSIIQWIAMGAKR
ncbi:MAG TPA: hypothetical protein VH062_15865 [Polyangiaceae bacterium]|jgi:hypothetical protein|nr:hypothetical protein [Polyangiaceae bacterium]